MTGEPANIPAEFSLKDYFANAWAVYRGDQTYSVELWFTSAVAKVVTETTWHPTQKVVRNKDGSIHVHFTVDGLDEITNWILSWTGKCKVIQPSELRRRVVEKIQAGLAMNHDTEDGN
jgi:predicted DNA-binding transcriptional regulator YafY